ncbi:hypothetical protein CHS0354_007868 [Potamilus streckersoni]|uniref:Uncharacterized protein n=1 Tax=Potamilus streckersoni TaxID=2493646 RepID=A0AAE0SZK4_9BIVA|nr:hypothetical protein CHS0354_007868 [Potamilus streckersoni]
MYTKIGLSYIAEATGPKPAYQIMCKTLGQTADLCFTMPTTELCPCDTGLSCHILFGSLGHCR